MHKKNSTAVAAAVLAFAVLNASAAPLGSSGDRITSGNYNGLLWTAQNMLTGVTNTQSGGPIANGGNPIYWPSYPRDSGIVHLVMDYGPQIGAFICSGSLMSDRRSILTAAHCVSNGAGTANPLSTTVYFQPPGGLSPGTRIQTNAVPAVGVETRAVTDYIVNALYTGDVIDHNDIAVLRMNTAAPSWAQSYGLYTDSDLTGDNFSVAGYGRLGDGATGANNFTARLRVGDNRYDFNLGNPLFGTNWASILGEPFGQISHSWLSDFDNGLAANDTGCRTTQASNFGGVPGTTFCDVGLGALEVGVAGGDSGGPNFINGLISGVNSYGLTFGSNFGDALAGLNSSFGEFSGYVPVYLHADFIRASMVPEPGTLALLGLGLAGLAATRRRKQ